MTWQQTTLGSVCELYQPQTLSKNELDRTGPYKVYGANGVIGNHTQYNHEEPQLLITCRGATCGTINISEPFSWINGNAMVVKPRQKNIDLNFLAHYLRCVDMSKVITGAAQPQITRLSLSPLEIRLPSFEEQQRMAVILDKAEAIACKREQIIARLNNLIGSVFEERFGNPITNIFNWRIAKLIDVCAGAGEYGAGVASREYSNDLPRYIRITDITESGLLEDKRVSPDGDKNDWQSYALNDGDIVFARSGATVGKTYLHRFTKEEHIFAGYLIRFRPNREIINPEYLFAFTKTNFYKAWVKSRQNVVAQPNINAKQYGYDLELPVPPIELQNTFASEITSINSNLAIQKVALNKLNLLIESLQNQAFTKGFNA